MQELLQHLSNQYQERAPQLVEEGRAISNATIQCALDIAETRACNINTSILIRRHAWL